MNKLLAVCVFFCLISQASADRYSTEDESRFSSQPYTKAEPGMLTPTAYIEKAKAALHTRYNDIRLAAYSAPLVFHRFYRDAPLADRDIICVRFAYKELVAAPFPAAKRLPNPHTMVRPALLVLMRKDLGKIYVNEVYYEIW
jgi:hypothetical protein